MRSTWLVLLGIVAWTPAAAQGVPGSLGSGPPTLAEVRRDMGIPSRDLDLRGQRDSVGFAWRADQMERVWALAATPPAPDTFGVLPAPGVIGVICPHDDYLYAGRVYRRVLPLVTARTVVLVGVFHRYRSFGVRDRLVFDPYRTWRSPDGPIPVSGLREELLAQLPREDWVQDAAMHDSEHSLEAVAYWLRHIRPDVEILPILVPAAGFERLDAMAARLSGALVAAMKNRGWRLGPDLAVVISSDGVHYGADFKHTPFGDGGVEAYRSAVEQDLAVLQGPLHTIATPKTTWGLYETFVDPTQPDQYRLTWCGRFSVPFGMLLLERLANADGGHASARPVAYATSVGWPALPVRDVGLGETAPSNLYHFVSYPAVAFEMRKYGGMTTGDGD
jgi:AmmeMemoRadiSam system protein B